MVTLKRAGGPLLASILSSVLFCACGADTQGSGEPGSGGGATNGGGGKGSGKGGNAGLSGFVVDFPDALGGGGGASGGGSSGNPESCGQLIATVRDVQDTHPDFQKAAYNKGLTKGLVKAVLDKDKLPEYAHDKATMITSQETFSQWYRDVDGVTMRFSVPLPLTSAGGGVFVFENNEFFPMDNRGFGNQGREHNFHFTTEIRGGFKYQGGEKFTFKGDDDVWVFVNGRLALDLGGVHGVETATIDFDGQATALGIEKGKTYTLDVFHAERHTDKSNFRMETTIECLSVTVL